MTPPLAPLHRIFMFMHRVYAFVVMPALCLLVLHTVYLSVRSRVCGGNVSLTHELLAVGRTGVQEINKPCRDLYISPASCLLSPERISALTDGQFFESINWISPR